MILTFNLSIIYTTFIFVYIYIYILEATRALRARSLLSNLISYPSYGARLPCSVFVRLCSWLANLVQALSTQRYIYSILLLPMSLPSVGW